MVVAAVELEKDGVSWRFLLSGVCSVESMGSCPALGATVTVEGTIVMVVVTVVLLLTV